MNFVNWSSGVDGQLPGFVAIASVILGLLAFRFTSHDISSTAVVMLAFIIAGAFLGFLPWNFYPQKIMPGYSGGALAGFLLGVLSILSWGKIGTLALVLAVPFIDAIYAIGRRITHRKSPFKGDASHFHHRLLRIGWGRRRIAVFYWCVTIIFGFAALYFSGVEKILVLVIAATLLAFFIVVTDILSPKIIANEKPHQK
jgi:UDP-GlcNAc:undecaprenyl-phosphate GlcNAc-1-phosphate transferase